VQEDWIRRLVHRRAVEIWRAIEDHTIPPELTQEETEWMVLELIHLMTAGDFVEACRAA
jgi:hypothetical protein